MHIVRGRVGSGPVTLYALGPDHAVAIAPPAGRTGNALGPDAADLLLALLRNGYDWSATAGIATAALTDGHDVVDLDALHVLAPLAHPGKIIAIGLNYVDHTAETGLEPPAEPLTFAKYPTSVIGPGAEIRVPTGLTTQVDWEGELAVVIGRECGPARRGTLADVAGYTIANDVSARDLQFSDGQWTRAKSLDTFCPLGPAMTTSDEIVDPHALRIWTTVNGRVMQDASTADLVFDIPALLHNLTAGVTLEPGDVVLTGTPPGVGGFREPPIFLADGDVVTVGIDRLGQLSNPVKHA